MAYLDLISHWQDEHPSRFAFIPIVSRDPMHDGLKGRIPELINNGSIESIGNFKLTPSNTQVMLCGNPDMIKESVIALEEKGLKKHLRRSPGQISMERYW